MPYADEKKNKEYNRKYNEEHVEKLRKYRREYKKRQKELGRLRTREEIRAGTRLPILDCPCGWKFLQIKEGQDRCLPCTYRLNKQTVV